MLRHHRYETVDVIEGRQFSGLTIVHMIDLQLSVALSKNFTFLATKDRKFIEQSREELLLYYI